ncbi:MAG: hypothetical protein HOO88_08120 [Kiritimatiellaceae bacterium]|nr:hypothetical protein [Kiritimatiellaceae bacterium]
MPVGGLATSFIMERLVCPAIFLLWRSRQLKPEPTGEVDTTAVISCVNS